MDIFDAAHLLDGVTATHVGAETDFDKLGYEISDDLQVTLVIYGQRFTAREHRRDAVIDMLENILKDYEAKALALDIREGNHG